MFSKVNMLWPLDTTSLSWILVNTGSCNGLVLPGSTKPLPESKLTYYQFEQLQWNFIKTQKIPDEKYISKCCLQYGCHCVPCVNSIPTSNSIATILLRDIWGSCMTNSSTCYNIISPLDIIFWLFWGNRWKNTFYTTMLQNTWSS